MVATDGFGLLYEFIEDPRVAAKHADLRPPVATGVAAYLLAAGSMYLTRPLLGDGGLSWFGLAAVCAWNLATGILFAAGTHLFAEILGGRGRVVPLFVMLGFSELAWSLAVPGALLLNALRPGDVLAGKILIATAGTVVAVLKARSIRFNYRFGRGQAWSSLLAPYAALAACLIVGAVGSLWWLTQQLSRAGV